MGSPQFNSLPCYLGPFQFGAVTDYAAVNMRVGQCEGHEVSFPPGAHLTEGFSACCLKALGCQRAGAASARPGPGGIPSVARLLRLMVSVTFEMFVDHLHIFF